MTTTINRQISLLVKGILFKYQIDNLQLEIDLVSSFQRMVLEGGKDPSKFSNIREDILDAMLANAKIENDKAIMEGRVKRSMGFSIDGRARYDDMLKFLLKKDAEGQTVEEYARWCNANPYDAPKFFKIAEKPDTLMVTWSMAFPERSQEVARPTGTGFYA